jgi:hypothetical protein
VTEEIKQKAIEKLQSEMESNNNNAYIQAIGQFLIKQIEKNPSAAEAIHTDDKSIENSLEAMKEEAQKKAVNGFAMFTPEEGFALVMNYFGISTESNTISTQEVAPKKNSRFDVKLDDFL